MKTKIVLFRGSRIALILVLYSSMLFSQTVESIYDTSFVKPAFQKKIFLSLKTGPVFLPPPWNSGSKMGPSFSASISFHLGKNFYLKPVFSFWTSKKYSPVNSFFAEVEYILSFDKISFPFAAGVGSSSRNSDGMIAFLMEAGAQYPLNEKMFLYLGGSFQPCASLDVGGGGDSFAPAMIYTGLSYRIK